LDALEDAHLATQRPKERRQTLSRADRVRAQKERERAARDELARIERAASDKEAELASRADRVVVADYPNQLRHTIPPWMESDKLEHDRWVFQQNARAQDWMPNDSSAFEGADARETSALDEADAMDAARERALSAQLDQRLDSLENTERDQSTLGAINHHYQARAYRGAGNSAAAAADPEELRQHDARRRAALAPVSQEPADCMDMVVLPPRAPQTSMPPPLRPATRRPVANNKGLDSAVYAQEAARARRFTAAPPPPPRSSGARGGRRPTATAAVGGKRSAAAVTMGESEDAASDDLNDYDGVHARAFDA
jgi:hypothetical protein